MIIKNKDLKNIIKLTTLFLLIIFFRICLGADDGLIVNQEVLPPCNENTICEGGLGETFLSCPSDCEACNNNGICNSDDGETHLNCPDDCEVPVCNNNGTCEEGETVDNCYADCYVAPEICNNNDICESNLGETSINCSNDCYTIIGIGNGPPLDLIQKGLIGDPIQIRNLEVSVGISGTIISWETNKPTISTLILGDGVGGSEKVFLDKLFMNKHSLNIGFLDTKIDHYFRIFSEGVYGDNNFGYVELYVIRKTVTIESLQDEPISQQVEQLINSEDLDEYGLDQTICFPATTTPMASSCGWTEFSSQMKSNLRKNKFFSFIDEFFWQILIILFILYWIYVLFIKKDERVHKKYIR
ncbi:MAG: hypothetical protein V1851_01555 [Patescibacteria group bacterium]